MASGEWISVRSQRELYENELRIEEQELAAFPEEEREELELIYQAKGVDPAEAKALVANIMARPDVALDTLAREELGLDPTALASPWVAAVTSFLAFAAGAFLPVVPFLFGSGVAAVVTSALLSVAALFGVGNARGRLVQRSHVQARPNAGAGHGRRGAHELSGSLQGE
jgi:VIT1/CCC1 family predicted Fe2+/Mn2+ transporter